MDEKGTTITGFAELTRLCTTLMVKIALGSTLKSISIKSSGIDEKGNFDIGIDADCNSYFAAFAAGEIIGQVSKDDHEALSEEKLMGMRLLMAAGAAVAHADGDPDVGRYILAGIDDIERLTRGHLADDGYMMEFIRRLTQKEGEDDHEEGKA